MGLRDRVRWGGDEGFSIIETVLAMALFAIIIVGVATTAGAGLKMTGRANGRQIASQIATREIEKARTYSFDALSIDAATTTYIDGDSFTPPITPSSSEPLVISVGGSITHTGTAEIESKDFSITRYVTISDKDGTTPVEKRFTVVVEWSTLETTGAKSKVVMTSLFSEGFIEHQGSSTITPTPSPGGGNDPTPATSATSCVGNASPAASMSSFKIAQGTGATTGYTSATNLSLESEAAPVGVAPTEMAFKNHGGTWSAWFPFQTTHAWTSNSGGGQKVVFAKFKSASGAETGECWASVIVDLTDPTPAPDLTKVTRAGKTKTSIELTWTNDTTDTDGNFVGYRIFRSVADGPFSAVHDVSVGLGLDCETTDDKCTWTDTPVVDGTGYDYYVVGYDKAGRYSTASDTKGA